jgi:hypothetical protein
VDLPGDRKPLLLAYVVGRMLNLIIQDAAEDKLLKLAELRRSDVEWALARSARLVGGALTQAYSLNLRSPRHLWVARADVTHFLLSQLSDKDWLRQAPFVSRGDNLRHATRVRKEANG